MRELLPYHKFDYAGATFAVFHADKGDGLPVHTHGFNHASLCQAGSCVVRVKGKEIVMNAQSQPLDLPAHFPHEIEALEDGTVFVNIFKQDEY